MRVHRLVCPLFLVAALAPPVAAQRYWHDDQGRFQIRLELLKPFLDGVDESFLTGAGFLSASGRVGGAFRLEGDIPFARFSLSDVDGSSGFRGGNPYVGMIWHPDDHPLAVRFGVRLPLSTDPADEPAFDATAIGILSDYDRFEAFLPEVLTARGAVEWRWLQADRAIVGLAVGPTFLFDTGDGGDDVELFGDYGVRVGYSGTELQATAAFTGRMLVTEDALDFSERTQHNFTGSLELRQGRVRPGVLIRVPIDPSVRDDVGAILGIDLRVVF